MAWSILDRYDRSQKLMRQNRRLRSLYWLDRAGKAAPQRHVRTKYRKVPKRFKKNLLAMKENKHIDIISVTASPVLGTSTVESINLTATGDTDATRDGDDIYIMSIQVKGIWTAPVDSVHDALVRVLLVKKIDCRGVKLIIGDLFISDNFTSMREIDNSKNFKILKQYNMRIPTSGNPAADNVQAQKVMNFYYKFKNPLRTKYQLATAVDGALDRNGLYLVTMVNNVVASAPTYLHTTRVTFKDV